MNTDIRLAVGFWQHPKTKKTAKRLGLEGIRSLQVLWLWVAVNRPDGILSGMDWEDIELAADWQGEERAFFECCLGSGSSSMWVDEVESGYVLHDWAEHNPWQAEAKERSNRASNNAKSGWEKRKNENSQPSRNASTEPDVCNRNAVAMQPHNSGNAPSPSPSPSPKPEEKKDSSLRSESSCPGSAEPDEQSVIHPELLPDDPPEKKRAKKKPDSLSEDSEAYRLAVFMRDELERALPTFKPPDLQAWAKEFDVAMRNDKRMEDARFVALVIRWVANDEFWRGNCQSPGKLRKQFDQLTARMEAQAAKARASPHQAYLSPAHRRLEANRQAAEDFISGNY